MQRRRNTQQRKAILDYLKSTDCHPRAEDIYAHLKTRLPSLSFGTVYRNLRVLCDLGEIKELKFGDSASRFDGDVSPHPHFVCLVCGRIFDLDLDASDMAERCRKTVSKFEVVTCRVELMGYCAECRR